MLSINENFLDLQSNYLFADIRKKLDTYKTNNPDQNVISLGIGDVTQPLAPAVIEALHKAVDEMANASTFRGYGPEEGYEFLRNAIAENDYKGMNISPSEIFVSDGAKSDCGNFQELFGKDCIIAVADPVYPVYIDSNVMSGRAGTHDGVHFSNIVYLPCVREHNFEPQLPKTRPDIIYLCYPNNPTGTVMSRDALKKFVDYAKKENCLILYDAAYRAFVSDDSPVSIYEIEGAKDVAVEFCSFSKTAGFTGLRCGYTIVPKNIMIKTSMRSGKSGDTEVSLASLWNRRQCTKFNGCPYIVQRAAEAVYSEQGKKQIKETIAIYKQNAMKLKKCFTELGFFVVGGDNSPYIWMATPDNMPSWDFFNLMLTNCALVCTPGVGFGPSGEGYVRFTAFGSPENVAIAIERIKAQFAK